MTINLAAQYKSKFLKVDKKNEDLESNLERIVMFEEKFKMPCTNWSEEQIEKFLKDLHSITPNSISRAFTLLKNFVKYICEEEKLECPEYKLDFGKLYDLVDYDKLLSSILTYQQFRTIYQQFSSARDRCLVGLPWHCLLSADEIKKIKESDISFETLDTGMDVAIIKISDTKTVKTKDMDLVDDLKQCLKDMEYIIETSDNKIKRMKYKDTEYLIKPTNVGRTKKPKPGERVEDYISNPTTALQKAIEKQFITCPGYDNISKLTIEDIKRSKLIYMLAPENKKYFSKEFITAKLDAGNIDSNLFWLEKVAAIKYKKK